MFGLMQGAHQGSAGGSTTYDFTTGSLPSGVTGTGGANGTRTNSSGVIVTATAARFDYTSAGVFSGLLVEPAQTNLLTQSEFASGWTTQRVTKTLNTVTSPSGSVNATTITAIANTGDRQFYQPFTATAAAYTQSVYAKAGTVGWLQMGWQDTQDAYFNLSTGALGTIKSGTTATITPVGSSWYRCTITTTLPATTNYGNIGLSPTDVSGASGSWTAAGTETIYIWGEQVELGSVATTYIPTTSASVTRTADAISITVPAGATSILFTFDDSSTQNVTGLTPGATYTFPTTLNRPRIRTAVAS